MSASASSSCRFIYAKSRVRLDSGQSATYIQRCHLKDLGIRSSARRTSLRHTESQGLLSTQGACYYAQLTLKFVIYKRTSRPANKLLTASFSPLSTAEIFSITMRINTRCSSETEARPSRTFSSSDRTPDGAGLVPWPSSEAGHGEPWGAV